MILKPLAKSLDHAVTSLAWGAQLLFQVMAELRKPAGGTRQAYWHPRKLSMQKGYAVLLCVLMQIFALVSHVIVRTSHANDLAMRTQLTQRLLDLEGRTHIGRSDVTHLRQAAARAIAARAEPAVPTARAPLVMYAPPPDCL